MGKGKPPKKDGWKNDSTYKRHQHNQACWEVTLKCEKDHEHDDDKCWNNKKICPFDQWERIR